ncbi:MAG: hypothetical protein AAGC55_13855, partial [Myxococcota bacterium]
WRRSIGPLEPASEPDEQHCGPSPVAEIHVWARRQPPRVAVARVAYVSPDGCETADRYLVWR